MSNVVIKAFRYVYLNSGKEGLGVYQCIKDTPFTALGQEFDKTYTQKSSVDRGQEAFIEHLMKNRYIVSIRPDWIDLGARRKMIEVYGKE